MRAIDPRAAVASLLVAMALASPARGVECGETVTGVLATPTEADSFPFQAAAGDVIGLAVSASPPAANFDPVVELRTAGGTLLSLCQTSPCAPFTIAASGAYVLRVIDFQSNATGGYAVTLESLSGSFAGASNAPPSPACGAAADGMRTVGCGETISGAIDQYGDTDSYSFVAAAGDRIGFQSSVGLELFAPGGARVTFPGNGTVCASPCATGALPATGVYTVRAWRFTPGPYSFTLESVGPTFAGAPSAAQCGTTSIACNQTVSGSLDALGDSDTFNLFAQAGEGVAVLAGETSPPGPTSFNARVDSFAPDGTPLASLSAPLPQTGLYTLRVTELGADATGSYELTAVSSQLGGARCDPFPDVRCGETVSGTGLGLAYRFHSFTAAPGDLVSIRAAAQIGVVAPGGAPVTFPSSQGFAVPSAGTYTLALRPSQSPYFLTLQTLLTHFNGGSDTAPSPICGLVPDGTRTIGCGQTLSGAIDVPYDTDRYAFFAAAGDHVSAQVEPNGIAPAGNFYVIPRVLDATGAPVSFCSLGCQISIPATGAYSLEVLSSNLVATGPYTVTLTRSPCTSSCNDGFDNDADGKVDFPADMGCTSADDLSEAPECDDGIDNDGDGRFDFSGGDPGCGTPLGASEDPACDDGFDNDADGTRDADGGGTGVADAACFGVASNPIETAAGPPGCGLGPELALLVPLLAALRRRRGAR